MGLSSGRKLLLGLAGSLVEGSSNQVIVNCSHLVIIET